MRNLKILLTILVAGIFINIAGAQEVLAYVETSEKYEATDSRENVEEIRIDRTGITELSTYLSEHVSFPYDEFDFTSEIKVKIQVSLNAFGEIIAFEVVETSKERVGNDVLKTLKNLKRVSPILVNGAPKAQTIQIPLIFKM